MSTANEPCSDGDADEADGGEDHSPPARAAPLAAAAPVPSLLTRPFLNLLAVQAAFGFALSVFLLLPKVLATAFASTPGQIGLVMAAFGLASVITTPLVSRAVHVLGQRGALVAANLVMAAGALGFVVVSGAGWSAVLMRGLHGLAWSLGFAAGVAIAADLAPRARLAQAVGIYGAASLAMNALAPALAEPIGERFGHRVAFVLAGASALLGAAVARRLPSGRAFGPEPGVTTGEDTPAASARRRIVYLVLGLSGLSFGVLFTFIAPFALQHGIHVVRGFFAAYTIAALCVRVGATQIADRLGHRRVACGAGVAYGLVVIAAGLVGPRHLLALGGAFGAAHGAFFPALMALVLGDTRGRLRARVLGLANGSMNLGLAAVFALGLLAGGLGYPSIFVVAGLLMVAGATLVARLPS